MKRIWIRTTTINDRHRSYVAWGTARNTPKRWMRVPNKVFSLIYRRGWFAWLRAELK